VHVFGLAALDARELLGVEAELEDVLGPRAAGELRVDDLVGAVGRRSRKSAMPRQPSALRASLVDQVYVGLADGSFGICRGLGLVDGLALRAELIQLSTLVLLRPCGE
jgi:hypothetical protein